MNRTLPVINKYLAKKWEEKKQQIHEKHLQSMRPQISLRSPTKYNHLEKKPKREMLIKGNFYSDWEKEVKKNNYRLEKNVVLIRTAASPKPRRFKKDSLNSALRKSQWQHIQSENQAILKRLQERMPNYSIVAWAKKSREDKKRMRLISQQPHRTEKVIKKKQTVHLKRLSATNHSRRRPRKIQSLSINH